MSTREKRYTFIDLFAGAGGFSEGLLQSRGDDSRFEFLLASDINENCELTHRARYNEQLGLDVKFVRMDAKAPGFVDAVRAELGGKQVDVVCGGPPCQSFSLAGRRRKNDKKDELFEAYLRVIRALKPRYFVMGNVTGILTKDGGAFRRAIVGGISSILDTSRLPELGAFLTRAARDPGVDAELLSILRARVSAESSVGQPGEASAEVAVSVVESMFRNATSVALDYRTSKTNEAVLTVRHGLRLLVRSAGVRALREQVLAMKAQCDIDQDAFVDAWDAFAEELQPATIVDRVLAAIDRLPAVDAFERVKRAVAYLAFGAGEALDELADLVPERMRDEFNDLRDSLMLYRLSGPHVLDASDYGVPQQRQRAVFIGCRSDQQFLTGVPATCAPENKVTVREALHDLDFLDADEEARTYKFDLSHAKALKARLRQANGSPAQRGGKSYAEWCRVGRLETKPGTPRYFASLDDFHAGRSDAAELHNHRTSRHNETVTRRMKAIQAAGGYDALSEAEKAAQGIDSNKRDYNLLSPDGLAPTIMTIADDYIHYRAPRALTVREMARLQSFDDSFVFQGKRTTGGDRRKDEVPQFTLVGNAVPPLLARAIGDQLLRHLEQSDSVTERSEQRPVAKRAVKPRKSAPALLETAPRASRGAA